MRYDNINSAFFSENRARFLAQMPDGAVCVFTGNDPLPTNADGTFGFIQNSTFFYLTGVDQEEGFLILVKGKGEWLFTKETSELIRVWDGDRLSLEEARSLSGVEHVAWLDAFWEVLKREMDGKSELWLYRDTTQIDRFPTFQSRGVWLFDQLLTKYPLVEIRNPAKIVHQLRLFKQAPELQALRKAIEITHKGLVRAARFLQPGRYEFEVEAEIAHEFAMNRSRFHAFMPIIASGPGSCILHYVDNHRECKEGELVLLDFGAEYGNYKADMTRVLPVNGTFSDRQAEVYASVLQVMKKLRALMVPGNTIANLKQEALHLVGEQLVSLQLLSAEEVKRHPEKITSFLPHGVSHSLGLDVHDVGDRLTPFAPGMVMTLEPGIYLREESIGIRLENDILITEDGNIDLMAHIPLEMEDIEQLMR